jgi:hypothetical protein
MTQQRAHSVTAGKFDKRLHLLSIFIVRKVITGLIIQYVSWNIIENLLPLNPKTFVFTVSSTVISFKNIHQDFTQSFCMNINNS